MTVLLDGLGDVDPIEAETAFIDAVARIKRKEVER